MYEIDSKKYFNEDNQNYGQMNNLTNKFKTDRSFNNSFQKENLNTAYYLKPRIAIIYMM